MPISPIISLSLFIFPSPIPYPTPASKNTNAIETTIEFINGELNISPVSGFLNIPLAGTTKAPINIIPTKANKPANFNPLFSFSSRGFIASSSPAISSPLYLPNLGSTIFSVTKVPIKVITTVEAIIKYQFPTGDAEYDGSNIWAPSVVIPANKASTGPGKRFALNPPDTPAKAAAIPASGCLPQLINITAPNGTRTT